MNHDKRASETSSESTRGIPASKKRELDDGKDEHRGSGRSDSAKKAPEIDALQFIAHDHQMILRMFADFRGACADNDEDDQRAISQEIIRALCVHSGVEDQVLMPALRKASRNSRQNRDVDRMAKEHQTAEDELFELKSLDPEDVRFEMKMNAMMQDVENHIMLEERELLPILRDACSRDELLKLGGDMEKCRKTAPIAPTHPSSRAVQGPLLPESPPKPSHHAHSNHHDRHYVSAH